MAEATNMYDNSQMDYWANDCSNDDNKKCKLARKWTETEQQQLMTAVNLYGLDNINWADVAKHIPGRTGKQCREKYRNDLRPDINKAPYSAQEEYVLAKCHSLVGNQWSEISKLLSGRSENSLKNHWNATLRSKGEAKAKTFLWSYGKLVLNNGGITSTDVFNQAVLDYKMLATRENLKPIESFKIEDECLKKLEESSQTKKPLAPKFKSYKGSQSSFSQTYLQRDDRAPRGSHIDQNMGLSMDMKSGDSEPELDQQPEPESFDLDVKQESSWFSDPTDTLCMQEGSKGTCSLHHDPDTPPESGTAGITPSQLSHKYGCVSASSYNSNGSQEEHKRRSSQQCDVSYVGHASGQVDGQCSSATVFDNTSDWTTEDLQILKDIGFESLYGSSAEFLMPGSEDNASASLTHGQGVCIKSETLDEIPLGAQPLWSSASEPYPFDGDQAFPKPLYSHPYHSTYGRPVPYYNNYPPAACNGLPPSIGSRRQYCLHKSAYVPETHLQQQSRFRVFPPMYHPAYYSQQYPTQRKAFMPSHPSGAYYQGVHPPFKRSKMTMYTLPVMTPPAYSCKSPLADQQPQLSMLPPYHQSADAWKYFSEKKDAVEEDTRPSVDFCTSYIESASMSAIPMQDSLMDSDLDAKAFDPRWLPDLMRPLSR